MQQLVIDPAGQHALTVERFFAAVQAADHATLGELLDRDAVTHWPQTGERITGAQGCIRVYANYPGGPPAFRIERIVGSGDVWVAQFAADYGTESWFGLSICEFRGVRISRITDYFGPALPAPEWRREFVDPVGASA
jgi:hypothetical protein